MFAAFFGLASGGVYMATAVAGSAVRSYRTFPSLLDSLRRKAVYFCCTIPRVASAGRYPAPCLVMLGLSSQGVTPCAAAQLTHML